jgi:hypothetical protein
MGLLDFSDPDSLSQLGMAFGLLNAKRGDNWPALLAQAAQAQEARKQRALQEQLMQQQLQMGGLDLKSKTQSFEDTQRARDILRGMGGEQQPPDEPMGAPVAPVRPFPAPGGGTMVAPGPASPGKNQTFAYYSALAQKMMQNGLPDQAQKYLDLAEKFRPKLKDTKTLTDPNTNQRVTVNFYEDGTREVVPFAPDKEKAHFADTGGSIAALDPYTGQPIGSTIPKAMTPGEVASNQVARGNLDLSKQRFGFEQSQANKPQIVAGSNGEVFTVDPRAGTGAPVVGPDGQPLNKGGKPLTESQAKASVYYGQMRGASDAANKIIVGGFNPAGKDQGTYTQARAASMLSENHPVVAAVLGAMTPAQAQKYQQSAEQWAEAYLRFNTGAATNHSEIVRYSRIFFPMPGDSKEVIAQKNQSRVQAEQMMRIAAGNGAAQADTAIGTQAPSNNDPLGIRK